MGRRVLGAGEGAAEASAGERAVGGHQSAQPQGAGAGATEEEAARGPPH